MVVLQTCKPFVLKKGLAESHRVASRDPTVDFWGFVNKTKPHTLSHIKQEVLARRVSAGAILAASLVQYSISVLLHISVIVYLTGAKAPHPS